MGTSSGTVTFLFTDIQGSTRLWQSDDAAMRAAVAQHDAVLQSAISERGGSVFSTMGDGVAAVFPSAVAAILAALEIQTRLQAEPWPTAEPIRVRMGLHSGEADVRDGDSPRGVPGTVIQFTAYLACLLHKFGDSEGALVLAEWSDQRGVRVPADNAMTAPLGAAELYAYREGLPAAEREHAARSSAALDESGVVAYARDRLAKLSDLNQ